MASSHLHKANLHRAKNGNGHSSSGSSITHQPAEIANQSAAILNSPFKESSLPFLLRPEAPRNASLLNSWKEIAKYLDRGIRTVQRWETELALPVHRPHGKSRGPVLAFRDELDRWARLTPRALMDSKTPSQNNNSEPEPTAQSLINIAKKLQALAERAALISNDRGTPNEVASLAEQVRNISRELTAFAEAGKLDLRSNNDGLPPPAL